MHNPEQKFLLNWKQKGNIYLWMFNDCSKSYKNKWHLWAEQGGNASLVEFIHLLTKAEEGAKRTVVLTHPSKCTFCPINLNQWNSESWDKLVIVKSAVDEICIQKQGNVAFLILGGKSLLHFVSELEKASSQNERSIGITCDNDKSTLIVW